MADVRPFEEIEPESRKTIVQLSNIDHLSSEYLCNLLLNYSQIF